MILALTSMTLQWLFNKERHKDVQEKIDNAKKEKVFWDLINNVLMRW